MKIDEEDNGRLELWMTRSSSSGSAAESGVAAAESGLGDLRSRIVASAMTDNAGSGILAEQTDGGRGRLLVIASNLRANAGGPVNAVGVEVELIRTAT